MGGDHPSLDSLGGWPALLGVLVDGGDLTAEQARAAMTEMLSGQAGPARTAALIVALRVKGETVAELSGFVDAMLEAAGKVDLAELADVAVDIVGTGGGPSRRAHALNVSTMASLVAAGAGAVVCKHGNRKASSTSGSFDLLEALGVRAELGGAAVARCVREVGIGFCYARAFHPAMRHVGPVRAELGVPTAFNVVGPLSNPAHVRRQVIGVSDPRVASTVAGVLRSRAAPRAVVVRGHDGLDELTLTGASTVHELRAGEMRTFDLRPEDVGLTTVAPEALRGGDPEANAAIARRVLAGESGPHRDIVVLNAAAGLWAAGTVEDIEAGVELARTAIDDGRAEQVLARLRELTGELASEAAAGS